MPNYDQIMERMNREDKQTVIVRLNELYSKNKDPACIRRIDGLNSCDCWSRWKEAIEYLKIHDK